jgi:hypothetical protein
MRREIKLNDLILLLPENDNIIFSLNGEKRQYPIPSKVIGKIEVQDEYIFLNLNEEYGNAFYQFKLEEGDFLVGDFFVDDELVETVACHVFAANLES